MKEDILNNSPTVMFRGTPCILMKEKDFISTPEIWERGTPPPSPRSYLTIYCNCYWFITKYIRLIDNDESAILGYSNNYLRTMFVGIYSVIGNCNVYIYKTLIALSKVKYLTYFNFHWYVLYLTLLNAIKVFKEVGGGPHDEI